MKKRVIVSACLLGEMCRYDGKTKYDSSFLESIKEYEVISFCPEAPLFGTPRERISVVESQSQLRIITDITKVDVSSRLKEEICSFMIKNPNPDFIILKSKSPSCGLGTTPIVNLQKNVVAYGDGIAASMMKEFYQYTTIIDELHQHS